MGEISELNSEQTSIVGSEDGDTRQDVKLEENLQLQVEPDQSRSKQLWSGTFRAALASDVGLQGALPSRNLRLLGGQSRHMSWLAWTR